MHPSFVASFAFRLLLFLVVKAPLAFGWRGGDGSRNSPCECYLVNGTKTFFFESIFWMDFRNLDRYSENSSIIEDRTEALASNFSSGGYFDQNTWRKFFRVNAWDNILPDGTLMGDATYPMVNSPSNVYVESNSDQDALPKTWLTLRTKRLKNFQAVGQFQTIWGNFRHVSLRMMARTVGKPGAVTSMFTYRDVTGQLAKIMESDLEILTRGPRNKIQYTNQPAFRENGELVHGASVNATTPDWSEWAVHRLDWTPRAVYWYVNGTRTAKNTYHVPRSASDLFFSAWSDGGSWSGVMEMGDEAKLQIQWIHLLFNTTDIDVLQDNDQVYKYKRKKPIVMKPRTSWKSLFKHKNKSDSKCRVVCSIDASDQPGREIILSANEASSRISLLGSMLWPSVLAMGLFFLARILV